VHETFLGTPFSGGLAELWLAFMIDHTSHVQPQGQGEGPRLETLSAFCKPDVISHRTNMEHVCFPCALSQSQRATSFMTNSVRA
jgi:hypothetical protein